MALLAFACTATGTVTGEGPKGKGTPGAGGNTSSTGGQGGTQVPMVCTDCPLTGPIVSSPGPSSRLVRLNHKQWDNTVRDLFRLPAPLGLGQRFITESVRSSFDNNGSMLEVSPELWADYQTAAEAVAKQVVTDAKLLASVVPKDAPASGDARAQAFIAGFGLRAYRRPLTDAETSQYLALFKQGPALLGGADAFADGVELVVAAILQSPHFLYRTELGGEVVDGKIALDDYQVASRLSYGLTGSMPDDALFAAAGQKRLHTAADVLEHAQRLLAAPTGQATLKDFHEQLYRTDRYSEIKRDVAAQPAWKAGMGDDMREESTQFIRDIVFGQQRGVRELLTASYTFVNSKLASLYGVNVPAPRAGQPDAFMRVELDKTQRAGLFTQVGWLGSNDNATDRTPRPIMRGVHISHDVLCTELPAPPNVPPLPPQKSGTTNRDLVTAFTEQPGSICQSCHGGLINPLGFAFEGYDVLGNFRTTDNGVPVDATATYEFDEGEKSYDGAVELMKIIADGRQAHECYSRRLFEFTYGREAVKDDAADGNLILEVGRRSKADASIKSMILDLLATDAFLSRLP